MKFLRNYWGHDLITKSKLLNLFQRFGGWSPFPMAVIYQMTLKCNLKCKMCFQTEVKMFSADAVYGGRKRPPGANLNAEEFERMLRNISEHCWFKPFFHITGGEPMVHPEFDTFLELLRKYRFKTALTTNGFFLERHIDSIFRNNVLQFNISIDGPEDIHDEIRGVPKSYHNAIAGIKVLLDERKKLKRKNPRVLINVVVHQLNAQKMVDFVRSIDDVGADVIRLQHIMFTESERNGSETIDAKLLAESIRRLKGGDFKTRVDVSPDIKLDDLASYYDPENDRFGVGCNIPWILFWVLPNGDVSPCFNNFVAGNLVDTPMDKIWNNEKMREFRLKLQREKQFPNCIRCCFRQYY